MLKSNLLRGEFLCFFCILNVCTRTHMYALKPGGQCHCTEQQMQVVMCQDKQQPTNKGKKEESHEPEMLCRTEFICIFSMHYYLFYLSESAYFSHHCKKGETPTRFPQDGKPKLFWLMTRKAFLNYLSSINKNISSIFKDCSRMIQLLWLI